MSGGAGFIGCNTVRVLLSRGGFDRVFVLDNFYRGSLKNLPESGRLRLMVADVSGDLGPVTNVLSDCEEVRFLHLAAIVSLEEAYRDPLNTVRVNVLGTANLLELARRLDAAKFVYASSVAVYGEPQYLPIDEEHPLRPANIYGASKLMGEELVRQYGSTYGLR